MTIKTYAAKWNRQEDNNFAVACYNDNTINELEEVLSDSVCDTDCRAWGISMDEWRDAINAALFELREDEAGV